MLTVFSGKKPVNPLEMVEEVTLMSNFKGMFIIELAGLLDKCIKLLTKRLSTEGWPVYEGRRLGHPMI